MNQSKQNGVAPVCRRLAQGYLWWFSLWGGLCGGGLTLARGGDGPAPADWIVRAGTVLTMNPKQPTAEAFAIRDGRFIAVGTWAEMAAYRGPKTRDRDLSSACILPGMIDAHAHPQPIFTEDSRFAPVEVGPDAVRTIEELIAAIRRKAQQTPQGVLIQGGRYQETKLGRHPTRFDLDQATTEHPVILSHSSGHLSVCNSLALRRANVTATTPNPAGGEFHKDAQGQLSGLLKEKAAGIVRSANPGESPPREDIIEGYRRGFRAFLEAGLTGLHVAGTYPKSADLLEAALTSETPLRLYIMLRENYVTEAAKRRDHSPPTDPLRPSARYGAIKSFHGNSLSGQTAWLYEPYAHRPDYFGIPPARTREELLNLVERIHTLGLQACIHANGDREIDMVLDAYEQIQAKHPRAAAPRHRIEHGSVMNARIVERVRRAGVVVAPHSYIFEHGDKMDVFGAQRWPWMHASKSLREAGVVVAGNSDYPVSAFTPLQRLQDLVRRTSEAGRVYGAEQCLSFDAALDTYTRGSAYAGFSETEQGQIQPGFYADFVVLKADPRAVPPAQIRQVPILGTFVGGRAVTGPLAR